MTCNHIIAFSLPPGELYLLQWQLSSLCRVLREMGHGFYIFWIMLNFGWIWTVGITRFTDYKHHMSDVLGGWFLGTAFGLIYCARASALHK